MTLLSRKAKVEGLIFAGSALAVLVGLAMPSQAKVMSAAQFIASIDEVKYICRRIDEPFWQVKREYGCGDSVTCAKAGSCWYKRRPNYPPRTNALLTLPDGPDDHHDGRGHEDGGHRGEGSKPGR
jgi:hypothetical protein